MYFYLVLNNRVISRAGGACWREVHAHRAVVGENRVVATCLGWDVGSSVSITTNTFIAINFTHLGECWVSQRLL